jgi:hypothetical protein
LFVTAFSANDTDTLFTAFPQEAKESLVGNYPSGAKSDLTKLSFDQAVAFKELDIIALTDLNARVDKMNLPNFAKTSLKQLQFKDEGEIVTMNFAVADTNLGHFSFIIGVGRKVGTNAQIGL